MCQKAGGAPFMAFAGVRSPNFVFTRGAPTTFAVRTIAERGFCADCGTPLTYRAARARPHLGDGRQSRPARPQSRRRTQLGVESRSPWLDGLAALPEIADRAIG